ncbi:MAG: hypothetical protein WCO56_21225 [Verrucomicrobiota bacterium]
MKSKLLIVIVALASFGLGAIGMACWCWYAYTRWMIPPKEVEMASWAARDTVALAHLRLNEPEKAIRALENGIDEVVSSLSLWDEESPPKETTRTARDRWLLSVKVYHESYPASGEGAERVNRLLSQVPGRSSASTCKNSICRLDDLHRAAVKSGTNSAADDTLAPVFRGASFVLPLRQAPAPAASNAPATKLIQPGTPKPPTSK